MAKDLSEYEYVIDFRIDGIPCQIGIFNYLKVPPWKGSVYTAPSDLDYYGYTESEWEILDRKGYPAKWLEAKITPEIEDKINEAIEAFYEGLREGYEADMAEARYEAIQERFC